MDVYRGIVETDPNNVEARYKLAVTLTVLGHLDRAVELFAKIVEVDPGHEPARRNLGRVRLRRAEKMGIDPSEPQGSAEELLDKAVVHLEERDYGLAHRLLQRARSAGAPASRCDRLAGDALLASGDLAGAGDAYSRALGDGADGVRAHRGLATVLERRGEFSRAAYHLGLFLRLARSEPALGALEEAEAERSLRAIEARLPPPGTPAASAVPPALPPTPAGAPASPRSAAGLGVDNDK